LESPQGLVGAQNLAHLPKKGYTANTDNNYLDFE